MKRCGKKTKTGQVDRPRSHFDLSLKIKNGPGAPAFAYQLEDFHLTSELGTGLSVDAPKPAISGPCPPVLLTNQVEEDGLNTAASVFPSPS